MKINDVWRRALLISPKNNVHVDDIDLAHQIKSRVKDCAVDQKNHYLNPKIGIHRSKPKQIQNQTQIKKARISQHLVVGFPPVF